MSTVQAGENTGSPFEWKLVEVVSGAGTVERHKQAGADLPQVDTVAELAGRSLTVKARAPHRSAFPRRAKPPGTS